jgi:hypothetical protein
MAPSARGGQRKAREEVVVSVTCRGREVETPVLRQLAAVAAIVLGSVMALVGLIVAVLGFAITAVLVPLSLPLHLVLRMLGRKGFIEVQSGRMRFAVEREGFRKAR